MHIKININDEWWSITCIKYQYQCINVHVHVSSINYQLSMNQCQCQCQWYSVPIFTAQPWCACQQEAAAARYMCTRRTVQYLLENQLHLLSWFYILPPLWRATLRLAVVCVHPVSTPFDLIKICPHKVVWGYLTQKDFISVCWARNPSPALNCRSVFHA